MINYKSKMLLAIPVYNCEKQIIRVLKKINTDILRFFQEVLIIDNISSDKTSEVAITYLKSLNIDFKFCQNYENINLGGSHKAIFDYSKENNYEYVLIIHGDDQADINDFYKVLESKTYTKYDWVRGSRFNKNSSLIGYSRIKTFGNIIFNYLFSLVLLKKIEDIGSGIDIYSTLMLDKINYYKFPNRLTFDYYMILYYSYLNSNIFFTPISWREEDQISNVKLFKQSIELISILINFIFSKRTFVNKIINFNKFKFKIISSS